jgi:hypothetical protein
MRFVGGMSILLMTYRVRLPLLSIKAAHVVMIAKESAKRREFAQCKQRQRIVARSSET